MEELNEHPIASVVTTVGSAEDARRLAREIVDRRLAACVQIDPGLTSVYRWQGAVCEEPELRLTIKTERRHLQQLQALLAGQHPYQLPQFLVTEMQASAAYAQWVRSETADLPAP